MTFLQIGAATTGVLVLLVVALTVAAVMHNGPSVRVETGPRDGHASEKAIDAAALPKLPDGPGPGSVADEAQDIRDGMEALLAGRCRHVRREIELTINDLRNGAPRDEIVDRLLDMHGRLSKVKTP